MNLTFALYNVTQNVLSKSRVFTVS